MVVGQFDEVVVVQFFCNLMVDFDQLVEYVFNGFSIGFIKVLFSELCFLVGCLIFICFMFNDGRQIFFLLWNLIFVFVLILVY